MSRIILSILIIFVGSSTSLFSQENITVSLSLRQCVQTAVEENINIKTTRITWVYDKLH